MRRKERANASNDNFNGSAPRGAHAHYATRRDTTRDPRDTLFPARDLFLTVAIIQINTKSGSTEARGGLAHGNRGRGKFQRPSGV